MDGLQVRELVVVRVDADAEEEPGVAPVYDFEIAELDEVGLVSLVSRSDEAVDFAAQADLRGCEIENVEKGC